MAEFLMPSLGADMSAGTLAKWRVAVGDTVAQGDIIAEVETDKGIIEVEVFESGVVTELLVAEGERVPVGTALAGIGQAADAHPKAGPAPEPGAILTAGASDLKLDGPAASPPSVARPTSSMCLSTESAALVSTDASHSTT